VPLPADRARAENAQPENTRTAKRWQAAAACHERPKGEAGVRPVPRVNDRSRHRGIFSIFYLPDLSILIPFIAAAFLVVLVPGITVSAVVSTALARGMAAGFCLEVGAQIARLSMVIVVAVALEAVTGLVSAAFDWIKYAGAAYLAWIGFGYLMRRSTIVLDRDAAARTPLQQIVSGFLVLWGNPKALIFFGAFLPLFVNPSYPAWPQVLLLGALEMLAALITDSSYLLVAAYARTVLTGRGAALLNRVAGVILMAAAVWLALQHQA
jgi:threonine/homoserine/homoserine lactone efflux protein